MTNITKLYQQLQEGKTTRDYFVREARRQFPQFISPVSSFNDIVNILKGKRLVSENLTKEVSGAFFDAPPATVDEAFGDSIDQRMMSAKNVASNIYDSVSSNSTDEEIVAAAQAYAKESAIAPEVSSAKLGDSEWLQAVRSEIKGFESIGKGEDYGFNDKSADREEASYITEAHKLDTEQILDRMSPYAVRKGIEAELKKEKVVDKTTLNKVKTRVARKLKKNPKAYEDLVTSNAKEIDKADKELETKEVKQELVDKKNAMRKPKGFKADKANTKASKKENRKGKPKGVKVMPDKGVTGTEKVIKENAESDVEQKIKTGEIDPAQVKAAAEKAMKGDSADLAMLMAGIPGKLAQNEEEEYMPRPGGPLLSPEDKEAEDFELLKMKVKGWYKKNFANPKSPLASKSEAEFREKVEAAKNKEELKQVVNSILMGDTSSTISGLGLNEAKQAVLNNIKEWLQENVYREYHVGMEVKTPDGKGVVKEVKGGTLTIELQDEEKTMKDYQFNIVNKMMDEPEETPATEPEQPTVDPDKAARDAFFAKLPGLGSVKGPDTGVPKSLYTEMTYEEKLKAIIEKVQAMEEGEKKQKALEIVKKRLEEAGDAVTAVTNRGARKVIATTKAGSGQKMVQDLKKQGITSAESEPYM